MQSRLDLNLLLALDVLLDECSVSAAADRLHLSAPAMSRTLTRIRKALGDPVLVRSGRRMVPTPRALALHEEIRELLVRAEAVFVPPGAVDPAALERVFAVQADESILIRLATPLLARLRADAPGVTVRFVGEGPGDANFLRRSQADLEVGHIRDPAPETRVEPLHEEYFAGVARDGHPLFDAEITPERFAAAAHLVYSRRGKLRGPIDDALDELGLTRRVVAVFPTFSSTLPTLQNSDLVGILGARLHAAAAARLGLRAFDLPLSLSPVSLSLAWHPRHAADPAHIWFRTLVKQTLTSL